MADPDEKRSTRIGTVIDDKYSLRRLLGVGAMGAVYEAVHAFTRKRVAVKVIDPELSTMEGYAQRFLREARAAAQIGHPAICDVIDAGQQDSDGTLYIVLELLEGRDLGKAIESKDLTTDEAVTVGAQVLDALAAAHDRGIVHRDIKPENIFLTRDEHGDLRIKLLDFGVAKTSGESSEHATQAGTVIGTPHYMSPEQAAGKSDVDGRADVWAMGATLFTALAGEPPYGARRPLELMVLLSQGKPPRSLRELRPDLPDWLIETVDGALRPDREERWSARQMCLGLTLRTLPTNLSDPAITTEGDPTVLSPSPFDIEPTGDSLLPPVEIKQPTGGGDAPLSPVDPEPETIRPGRPDPPSSSAWSSGVVLADAAPGSGSGVTPALHGGARDLEATGPGGEPDAGEGTHGPADSAAAGSRGSAITTPDPIEQPALAKPERPGAGLWLGAALVVVLLAAGVLLAYLLLG